MARSTLKAVKALFLSKKLGVLSGLSLNSALHEFLQFLETTDGVTL